MNDSLTLEMSAAEIMVAVVPGSGDWDWLEEARTMLATPHLQKLRGLMALFAAGDWSCTRDYTHGGQWITLGPDGRLWDGHHRVVAAWLVDPNRPLTVHQWEAES